MWNTARSLHPAASIENPICGVQRSLHRGQVDKDNDGRVSDGRVLAGERQTADLTIHLEHRDVVAALIAAVEEPTTGIDVEAARVIASRPLVRDERQIAVGANGEDSDAVVQAVARVHEAPV